MLLAVVVRLVLLLCGEGVGLVNRDEDRVDIALAASLAFLGGQLAVGAQLRVGIERHEVEFGGEGGVVPDEGRLVGKWEGREAQYLERERESKAGGEKRRSDYICRYVRGSEEARSRRR